MLKRGLLAGAVLMCAAIFAALAVADDVGPFAEPAPEATTVPPKGPGEDYKSNPAPGEELQVPDGTPSTSDYVEMTIEEAQRRFDPNDDPSFLICKIPDGGFRTAYVRWVSPEAAAKFQASKDKQSYGLINDKAKC